MAARALSTNLPDYNTRVDVANIKLSKPRRDTSKPMESEAKAARRAAWQAKDDAQAANAGSLVEDTLAAMEVDAEFQLTAKRLKQMGQKRMTLEEKKTRRRALSDIGVPPFEEFLAQRGLAVARAPTEIMQLNIGLYCNQACNHCHVESSPKRTETMSLQTVDRILDVLAA